ncbi:DUF4862 family protein [Pseudarthrobacter oxydans]|jgi:hypothetical protein|uniref:DUF4862 family protein n=1 Tax=Pseudarthrobacter oxydans TaxID=1671 RepID=UPI00342F66BB
MSLIVGAYPAQPEELQQNFYQALGSIPSIRGLELPYGPYGGSPWPAGAPEDWSAVVTAIPGTMKRVGQSSTFGLASRDSEGRRAALEFVSGLRDYASRLAGQGHRVEAVELHSAPSLYSSALLFEESLKEVLDWEWGSTRVLVEHCDALRWGSRPEKGFLPFDEEVNVVASLQAEGWGQVGIVVNWARSVIESGDTGTAVEHLLQAREAGVLAGVMFSGCSPEATEFGYPWIDAHLPAVEVDGAPPSSLLNRAEVQLCLAAAGPVAITGFKIGLPQQGLSVQDRAGRLQQMCDLVQARS